MPGIIGFAGRPDGEHANRALLQKMARMLEPESLFSTHFYAEEKMGLGRVSLGIVNPGPQPVWNESRSICLVMEGEIYNSDALRSELESHGRRLAREDDAYLLLHLYEAHGVDFVDKANGAFVAAIWEPQAQKVTLLNDRLGLQPLYYSTAGTGLLFGSGVRALLAAPDLPRCVDKVSLAQFLTFDHLLHQRTLLEDVSQLPQASFLTYQDGEVFVRPYWRPYHPETYELRREQEWMEALREALQRAVKRQAPNGTPAGMLLSGGMDSRVLLALLRPEIGDQPFSTFTWGIPGCDDARYAREVAAKLGVKNHFFELKPDWLLELADECVRCTDGMGNVVNLHARATLDPEAQEAPILYKGFLGDAMMGFAQRPQHWAEYDPDTAVAAHLQVHGDQGVITFAPEQHGALFTAGMQQAVGSAVMDSYGRGMLESASRLLADQRIYFDYCQRVPRHTLNGVQVARSRAVVRLPFADYDLIDLMLQVPPGLRYERRLMRNTFIAAFPDLARIPMPDSGLPLLDCARAIRIRSGRWLRWHLNKVGVRALDYAPRRPYKDYNSWFRGVLRPWVEETLLAPHALQRGYFNPQFVKQLVAEHMAGKDHSIRLGALLSIELWHQQFID